MDAVTLSWSALIFAAPVMIFAGLVHGALGLGFPMVATPLIALFVDVRLAIVMTLLPTAVVNVTSVAVHKNFQSVVARYFLMALATILGSLAGSAVLAVSQADIFRLLLALLILVFLWTQFQRELPQRWLQLNRYVLLALVGVLAGFAGGTTNVMVAVLLIYFLSAQVARAEMVTAMNLCFLLGKISQIIVFLVLGLVTPLLLVKTAPLAAVAFGSLLAGQKIGSNIPREKYQRWLRYLLAAIALILIVQFVLQIRQP